MKIEMMTYVSHILTVGAIIFACLSVVLFFALDIRRIWTVLYGKGMVTRRLRLPLLQAPRMEMVSETNRLVTEKLTSEMSTIKKPVTERLAMRARKEDVCAETRLSDETEPVVQSEIMALSLIQDITCVEACVEYCEEYYTGCHTEYLSEEDF